MIRIIVGCLAGVFLAGGLVAIFEGISHVIAPPPADLDISDRAAMTAYVAQTPVLAKLVQVVGWALAALIGSGVAAWISKRGWSAWVIGGLMLAAMAYSLIVIPHPLWMIFASIAGLLFATIIGAKAAEIGSSAPDP